MPSSQTKRQRQARHQRWPAPIERALRSARRRLRVQQGFRRLLGWFSVPLVFAVLWIGLSRFTLLDLPRWPVAAVLASCLAVLLVWVWRLPITTLQAAHYIDRELGLDERLATSVEVARAEDRARLSPQAFTMRFNMVTETSELLAERLEELPNPFKTRLSARRVAGLAALSAVLLATIVLPTPLDAVRAERAQLQATLQAQLKKIDDLRADILTRPDLSSDVKQTIASRLIALDQKLRAPGLDRSAMLADLADAQQQMRQLSSSAVSDFDPLISAALSVQAGVSGNADWVPADARSQTELGRAAEAATYLSDVTGGLTNVQRRSLGQFLDRAATQASPADQDLANDLSNASKAIAARDAQQSQSALVSAANRFQAADREQAKAEAVDSVLSKLDEGRQSIAQTGAPEVKKPQIGFRRHQAPQGTAAAGSQGQDGAAQTPTGNAQAGSTDPTGQQQARIGNNMPAFGAPTGGGQPNSHTGAQPGNPSAAGSGTGGQPAATGSSGAGGGSGQSGGGAGQGGAGGKGTLSGQVSGPVGSANGAISQVQNPMGNGVGGTTPPSTGSSGANSEQIYVPSIGNNTGQAQVAGDASPQSTDSQSLPGRTSQGSQQGGKQDLPGVGSLTPIHTPYSEVIGQYAQKATQALDRTYIPADAKEYVKDYFTALSQSAGQ